MPIFLEYFLSMGSYFVILLGVIHFMRKHGVASHYIWIASLLTIPFWLGSVSGWFRWVKMLSVLVPVIILGFTRLAQSSERKGIYNLFKGNWVLYFFYAVITMNILEATLKDVALGHYLNALPGFILIITVPMPIKYWEVSKEKSRDILCYSTYTWSILYTTWNACFVYGESPAYFFSSCCILMAAMIYPMLAKKPELYMTARIYSLITHLIIRASLPLFFLNVMDASQFFSPVILTNWGVFNAVFGLVYLVWYAVMIKKNAYKTEILPLHQSA